MKKVFLLLAILSSFSFAEIIEVDIPEVRNYTKLPIVTVSRSYMTSGCSDKTIKLSVLKSEEFELYVIGKTLKEPVAIGFPITCKMIVTITEKASFAVYGNPGSIAIELPDSNYKVDVKVKSFPVY